MSATLAELHKEEDLITLSTYIKEDLYPKVKFIYGDKTDLKVGGLIYNDYRDKCKVKMKRGRHLTSQPPELLDTYMESIWNQGVTLKTQRRALSAKRSVVYTVMQNKFSGKQISQMGWFPYIAIAHNSCIMSVRFVYRMCRTKMYHDIPREYDATPQGPQGILPVLRVLL